ncbi:MAG: porin family protein [Saprospiraceae bacterium]|nr:porin family protein [Saprospiraceae bacterium]
MQKSVFLFAFALLMAGFLHAQVQTSVGAHVGINLAKVVGDSDGEDIDTDSRTGFLFGAVAEFRFNDNIAVQPELNFIQKGFKEEFEIFPGVSEETELILNYLEIPILFKAGGSVGSNLRLDGLVGPSFGFGIGDAKIKVDDEDENVDWEEDLGFQKFDFGVQIGGMVSYNLGSANLFLDGRYLLGLSNLLDDAEGDDKANNRGIAFSLGVLFPLGGE